MVRGRTNLVDPVMSDLGSDVRTLARPVRPSNAYKAWNSGENPWTLSKHRRKSDDDNEAPIVEHLDVDVQKPEGESFARTNKPNLKDDTDRPEDDLPLSDPRSWIWKDRQGARIAVVVESRHLCTSGTLPRQLEGTVNSDASIENGDVLPGKSKGRLWLQKVEIPLLPVTDSKLNQQKPRKDCTLESFFGPKPVFSNAIPKSGLYQINKNSKERTESNMASKRRSHLSRPKSPLAAHQNKTLLNNGSTDAINTNLRQGRLPRAAVVSKRNLPTEIAELSLSDDDDLSMSDASASTIDSDEFNESASTTDSEVFNESVSRTDTETPSQSGDGEESSDEDLIVPIRGQKRQKILRLSQARKRTKKLDPEASSEVEYSEEADGTVLSTPLASTRKNCAKDYQKTNNYTYRVGIDETLQPLCKIEDIFVDMTARACKLGFMKVVNHLQNRKLRVGTMCSGTESPILALRLVSDALKKEGIRFEIQQIFAAEIEAWKQAYGEHNIGPPTMFRDVRDFSVPDAKTATTAYGALVRIPGDLDLLVAGFSCVDFSGLNNKKKTLEAGGESGDTFKGIRDYAQRWRPKIIILENVSGAPWDRIRDQAMVNIGYRAEYLKVDTKDYYLPHTRVRGYMICIDARENHDPNGVNHIPKSPQMMTSVLKTWVETMKAFKRPASCLIEAFLLDEDDPRLSRAREELSERDNTRSRVIDWACCHGRHQDYRMALSLGSKRPITKWLEGGFCEPLDFMWIDFIRTQPERVQDMIDISYLRNLDRGFDHHFKTRILELSQNVDRVTDTTKVGVTGCITPTGIPFSTTRGGPLTGLEVLSIQGLPIDRLQLSRQKQSQLQDLAGNAMSSTVVGAAILAALIASYRNLPIEYNDVLKDETATSLSRIYTGQDMKASTVVLSNYEPLSVVTALKAAKQSVRMCRCEGPLNITSLPLQKCTLCQHTTCVKCGGNPRHAYAAVQEDTEFQRRPPTMFADLIKKAIPMIVSLAGIGDEKITQLGQSYNNQIEATDWNILLPFVRRALKSEFRFYSIKRSEIWTVRYESRDAHLELIISADKLEWRVFGKPPQKDAGNSRIRQLLSHPVARMIPKGDDITQGIWQFWLPKVHKFAICFTSRGGLTSSYEDKVGIARYLDTQVWREYSISVPDEAKHLLDADICGDYELLQDCGTASGALHVQTKTNEKSRPIFLFFDPHSLHDPKKDFFVFSSDKRRLNYGDVRTVIARLDPNWRPPKIEKLENSATGVVMYKIDNSINPVLWTEAQLTQKADCYVDGRWIDLTDVHFEYLRDEGALSRCVASALPLLPSLNSCGRAYVIFLGKAKLPEHQVAPWSQNKWVEISSVEYSEFFRSQAWLTEKACSLENFTKWSYENASSFALCSDCAPPSPTIKWKLQAPKFSKKFHDNVESSRCQKKELLKYIPFEDPEEAARHERLIKNRPSPLVTQVLINDTGLVQLKLAINPETLMHRALAKLSTCQNNTKITLKWRLITTYSMPSRPSLPPFILKDNKSDSQAQNPSGFLYSLRPEQARSLNWMISQEIEQGQIFIEEETEEALIPQIRWRAEGRAQKDVHVRGGVLADQVGYGKTVTTLALIASQRCQDAEEAKKPINGCIPLKATLILVPPQLPDQWDREVKKFLHKNDKYKVLVIKNLAALQNKTVAQFHEADIIIASWRLCEGDSYLFKVAQFAGMVELAEKSSSRASAVWYEEAMKAVADHVDELKRGGEGLKDMVALKLAENEKRATEVVTIVPSKRLRGQAYQAAKEDPTPGPKRKHGQARSPDPYTRKTRPDDFGFEQLKKRKMNWTSMKCPLLELFKFSRIVVDEYTYVTGQESLTISNIKARCRWILSATPPLVDFIDVKNIARFLGVHLGIEDITPGITKAANIKALEKEKTDSELFQSFKPSQSPAWHERRHKVAQRFLDQFARQNIADINAIQGSEHIRPVYLPAAERAIYLENSQNLLLNDLTIKKGRRNVDNDRARRFQELADRSATPGEILMKCASHFTLDDTRIATGNAFQACEKIVAIRCKQAERLREDFQKRLKQAVWLKGVCTIEVKQYVNWRNHVDTNAFGDLQSMSEIKSMISQADMCRKSTDWQDFYITAEKKAKLDKEIQRQKANKKARTRRETGSESGSEREELIPRTNRRVKPEGVDSASKERAVFELREVTAELRRLSAELVNRRRCLRFFERVRELQQLYACHEENVILSKECACSKCGKNNLSPDSTSVLCQCGHVICDVCLGSGQNGVDECFAQGCSAANKPYQIIKAKELGVESNSEVTAKHYGKKIEDIVALVKKIPEDEQVLLFVQFPDLMAIIASAFRDDMITYSALGESGDPAKKLTEFQTNKNPSSMKKVLMLNIGDSSAAGSNLTNANHVIFVSPFLTDSDTLFDQAMTQAEGRARRYGQLKHVHIYRFLSLKTIDVDVIQARNKGKYVARNWASEPEVKPFTSFIPSTFDLVEEHRGVSNEFGSGESGSKILGL